MTDTPFIYLVRGYLSCTTRFTNLYLVSTTKGFRTCSSLYLKCKPEYNNAVYSFAFF